MPVSEKKSSAEHKPVDFDQMVVDFNGDKYRLIVTVSKWAKHLAKTDEYKNLPAAEVIKRAVSDVLSGKVTLKEIEQAVTAQAVEKVPEEKKKEKELVTAAPAKGKAEKGKTE